MSEDIHPQTPKSFPKNNHYWGAFALWLIGICAIAFVAWGLWEAAHPPVAPLQGQMESRNISISAKVAGRIHKVLVSEGDNVQTNQPIIELLLPEIEAKLAQVESAKRAAQAKQSLVDEGARPQEKAALLAQFKRAQAAETLARQTYKRIAALYKEGLVAAQRYDEAKANLKAASEQAVAAKNQYDIAQVGAREQEKQAVAALTAQAGDGVSEVASLAKEKILLAPLSAQVDRIILTEGELAPAGFPLVTLVDLSDQWVTLNIREDQMPGIEVGRLLSGKIPALGGKKMDFSIYYISPRANYATWRSTRQSSGYDMRSFEVRARPSNIPSGLRPGMSVLVDWPQ